VQNCKLISNLTFISTLIKRIIDKQLSDCLAMNESSPIFQSAYRRYHFIETIIKNDMSKIIKGPFRLFHVANMRYTYIYAYIFDEKAASWLPLSERIW